MHTRSVVTAIAGAGSVALGLYGMAGPAQAAVAAPSKPHKPALAADAARAIGKHSPGKKLKSTGPDASKVLGGGCGGFWFSPPHIGDYVYASAEVLCTNSQSHITACANLQKLRWFGWSSLGISCSLTSPGYKQEAVLALVSNYCKGAGTYTYMNVAFVSRANTTGGGSPTHRFTC